MAVGDIYFNVSMIIIEEITFEINSFTFITTIRGKGANTPFACKEGKRSRTMVTTYTTTFKMQHFSNI